MSIRTHRVVHWSSESVLTERPRAQHYRSHTQKMHARPNWTRVRSRRCCERGHLVAIWIEACTSLYRRAAMPRRCAGGQFPKLSDRADPFTNPLSSSVLDCLALMEERGWYLRGCGERCWLEVTGQAQTICDSQTLASLGRWRLVAKRRFLDGCMDEGCGVLHARLQTHWVVGVVGQAGIECRELLERLI